MANQGCSVATGVRTGDNWCKGEADGINRVGNCLLEVMAVMVTVMVMVMVMVTSSMVMVEIFLLTLKEI